MLLSQMLKAKKKIFSFEVFPANTPQGHAKLLETIQQLCLLKPDFISCTYGAGGGARERTFDVVEIIQKVHGIPSMAHLTCVLQSRSDIETICDEFERRGINNILALRGDIPKGTAVPQEPGDFRYSSELVEMIRRRFREKVAIGVAGFPEKHPLAPDASADARYLKQKITAGADFVITQLFFDNRLYFEYVERLRKIGVSSPVLPGILPITDYAALRHFCERCGASIPRKVHEIFGPIAGDAAGTVQAGIDFTVEQCRELLDAGVPGIHLYTLNKTYSVERILHAVRE
jgi:methylenetetrahydrofolate reductase (NADPH)